MCTGCDVCRNGFASELLFGACWVATDDVDYVSCL